MPAADADEPYAVAAAGHRDPIGGLPMKDRFLTVALSVAATLLVTELLHVTGHPPREAAAGGPVKELVVDRLIVREELIVSDTGEPWEAGFERHQIARGMVVRSLAPGAGGGAGTAGLWVRGRLIKTEIDDPFDDRFHAINRDGSIFRAPGHISWNVWLDGAWRQVAIIQGEGLEYGETPREEWGGGNHPGRLRLQSFRPHHGDAIIGQGMMSLGGGGYGGGGLPYPSEVLQLWGGVAREAPLAAPGAPRVAGDDGSGEHRYALIAGGPQGGRSGPSPSVTAKGFAALAWDSLPGADAYFVLRDGREIAGPLRIEGSEKRWTDRP
jgi:hypothetical protein